jgi:hypothetical protein
MNEKQLAKLIKQNAAKAAAKTSRMRPAKAYDATLPSRDQDDADVERTQMFKDMKRREF